MHIRCKLNVDDRRQLIVLPAGVLVDGTGRRTLDKFSPEGVLAYSDFTRAALRAGDLLALGEPFDPTATTTTED